MSKLELGDYEVWLGNFRSKTVSPTFMCKNPHRFPMLQEIIAAPWLGMPQIVVSLGIVRIKIASKNIIHAVSTINVRRE